jgi:formylglycine-generating enzyme required for sulfatase activity
MTNPLKIAHSQPFEVPLPQLSSGARPLRMFWVSPTTFLIGSPMGEWKRRPDERQVQVTISKGFWLSECPITQAQFAAIPRRTYLWPSLFSGLPDSEDRPVETVSWVDAAMFCEELCHYFDQSLPPGYRFSLPTEAQWECSCRAGTRTLYHSGNSYHDLDRVDWHAGNSGGTTHPVGQKPPNRWGFRDMHGNVAEWCFDWYDDYPLVPVIDWHGPDSGEVRTIRGGGWRESITTGEFRSAARCEMDPKERLPWLGFRLALSPWQ